MFGEIESFGFVYYITISPLPKRMPSSNQLVHDEASCPYIDCLSITLPACHLLRSLIDKCTTGFVHALAGLVLYSESEVDKFYFPKLIGICKNYIAGL
jgi:hypothetical protein